MNNLITLETAIECAGPEGIVRQAYKDSVGVWTWSVGLTNATGHIVTRYIDEPQPMKRCLEVYIWALQKYANEVNQAFAGHFLTEGEFTSALSFHWNTGAIATATWVKNVKAGDDEAGRKNFMNYRTPVDIIERREKERDLFFDGIWQDDDTINEYTQLTKKHTPVWASAKQVDVRDMLRGIIAGATPPPPDVPMVVASPKKSFWKGLF